MVVCGFLFTYDTYGLQAHIYAFLNGHIFAGICEINAQIYASYKGPDYYILVLECVYMRVSQIMLYMPAREMPFAWLFVYDNNENIVNMVAAVKCLVFYLLFNVCYFSPTTELLERVDAPFE